jgi:IclR family transcriptional regulator, KDG regulon repressor
VNRARRDGATLTSVQNAARLLKEFGTAEGSLGVTELARRLQLGKSTVHRLLATLTAERILEHDPTTGTYRLGLMMWELGARVSVHRVLHDAATTVLEELRNATKETVQVAVLDGREVVYVERLESPHTLRLFGRVGHRNWAHCTSTGKVLLAFLPERRLEALLEGWRFERKTDATICHPGQLRAELERVRAQGWAENIGESELGVASVAAPIRNARGGVIAAVSVAGPVMRVNGDTLRSFFRASVIQAADGISDQLGWRADRDRSGRGRGRAASIGPVADERRPRVRGGAAS